MSEPEIIDFEIPEEPVVHDSALMEVPTPLLNVEDAVNTYHKLTEFVRRVLVPGIDYGTLPGTNKPTMFKPGAEKMRRFFGLFAETTLGDKVEGWDTPITETEFPLFSYNYITIVRDVEGNVITASTGNCNSYETKYRWRWTDDPAPWDKDKLQSQSGTESQFDFAIKNGETTGKYGKPEEYWQGWRDDIESGKAKRIKRKTGKGKELDAWERGGTIYRVPNENVYDILNTIMKMAQKRSFIGAVLAATGASEFFTQDMDDKVAPEDVSISAFVPDKDTAARKLMQYVRTKGKSDAGEFIKATLEEAGVSFSLDNWQEVLDVIAKKLEE